LVETRPDLGTSLPYTKAGRLRQMVFHGGGPPETPADKSAVIELDAIRLARTNLDAAIAKTQELPAEDGSRPGAQLRIARTVAADHPDGAAQLIDGVVGSRQSDNEELRLNVLAAQAYLASGQNQMDDVHAFLQRGFDLAARVMAARQKADASVAQGGAPRGLQALVQIGIQNDPALTLGFLQTVPPGAMKADLFLAAATALRGPRLPVASDAKQ